MVQYNVIPAWKSIIYIICHIRIQQHFTEYLTTHLQGGCSIIITHQLWLLPISCPGKIAGQHLVRLLAVHNAPCMQMATSNMCSDLRLNTKRLVFNYGYMSAGRSTCHQTHYMKAECACNFRHEA